MVLPRILPRDVLGRWYQAIQWLEEQEDLTAIGRAHPDRSEFCAVTVRDRRLVVRLHPERADGM